MPNEFSTAFSQWGGSPSTSPYLLSNNATLPGLSNGVPTGGSGVPGSYLGSGAPTVGGGFNWGTAGNAMGAIQGGIGIYNNIMDILGKSDADKQRKFAKTFTMREWNTKARMHDNQLQMGRNKVAMWNAANPGRNQLTTFGGLKTLGTWGSKPGRTLDAGTQAQYSGNQNPQPPRGG